MSYKAARALALVEHPMIHVYDAMPEFQGEIEGNCTAEDPEIARWCGLTNHVLVTTDEGFRGRWVRTGVLEAEGVEVIVFAKEIKGLTEQHRRLTLHLPHWQQVLGKHPYAHRVWEQTTRQEPRQVIGRKAKAKSRATKVKVTP